MSWTTRNAKLFLLMVSIQILAVGLSNVFVNVYFWSLSRSLMLLAWYSLTSSIAVLASFPIGAILARRTSAMWSMRLGILFHIVTFSLVILLKQNAVHYIGVTGLLLGCGVSFFVIGQHLQTLDETDNHGRDAFLFTGSFMNNTAILIAPIIGGFVIDSFRGQAGYDAVFSLSVLWFFIEFVLSFQVKSSPVPQQSHLRQVWTNPTRAWRRMYWVTMATATVDGTYSNFLVTIMVYTILQNTLSLGGFKAVVSLLTLLSSIYLAKRSSPSLRMYLYASGAILVSVSSIILGAHPDLVTLAVYMLLSAVGFNLVNTMLDSWSYASIEQDVNFGSLKLDYLVIREVPLGVGRMIGIGLFVLLNHYFKSSILGLSLAVFGSVYVLLIPILIRTWSSHGVPALVRTKD